ncbi:MAG: hypothetical protein DI552_07020 [Brevundimonas sp.]|jgi:hypothetical protein|uniref:hypothetical protein n=1 Tax=Brevundimonas sp. TaxID=1871086 RepID=UPI000DBC3436|nr:hypothetical protein [Brevundimonas sp.]PZU58336.1 MAG: hypothetical protein DI552_07020 [Brevundimonas sp.]
MRGPGHDRIVRLLLALLLAGFVAAVATALLNVAWSLMGGGALTLHGWIALSLGVVGTVLLTWVLMALAFKSNREGWDDRVDNRLDPGREDD